MIYNILSRAQSQYEKWAICEAFKEKLFFWDPKIQKSISHIEKKIRINLSQYGFGLIRAKFSSWIDPSSDYLDLFWLKILFTPIRVRIESNGFLTDLYQTISKNFFRLFRIDSEYYVNIFRIGSDWIPIQNFSND